MGTNLIGIARAATLADFIVVPTLLLSLIAGTLVAPFQAPPVAESEPFAELPCPNLELGLTPNRGPRCSP
jgi:hypothetical protein